MIINEYAVGYLTAEREKAMTRELESRRLQLERWAEEGCAVDSVPARIGRRMLRWIHTRRGTSVPVLRRHHAKSHDRLCETG